MTLIVAGPPILVVKFTEQFCLKSSQNEIKYNYFDLRTFDSLQQTKYIVIQYRAKANY